MVNEYYGVPSTPNENFIAHYGIKGMRWGVRKALASGNEKALAKQYKKAAKKLKKLQDIGINSKKYAAKAAAYGAAAAGTGTLAVGGKASQALFNRLSVSKKAQAVTKAIGGKVVDTLGSGITVGSSGLRSKVAKEGFDAFIDPSSTIKKVGQSKQFRGAMALTSAALGGKALQNAYRAASGKRYRAKAENWKKSMDENFAGTKYAGRYDVPSRRSKKRR